MPKNSGVTFQIGQLVWAKMKGFPFWPAKVTDPEENKSLKRSRSKKNTFCVKFFGTGDYASISVVEMRPYFNFKEKLSTLSKKSNFLSGLKEVEDYIAQNPSVKDLEADFTFNDDDGYRQWAKETKDDDGSSDMSEEVDSPSVHPPKKLKVEPKLEPKPERATHRRSMASTIPSTTSKTAATNGMSTGGMSLTSQALSSSPRKGLKLEPKKIGFIGIGTMGSVLAKRLISAGHEVVLCSKSPKDEDDFKPGRFVESPGDLIDECDIIVSCVSGTEAVREVVLGFRGISERFVAGKSYVELATVDLQTVMEVQDIIASRGGRYLEAPMSGTVKDAREGKMVFLCSGDRTLFEEMEPCLHALGRRALFVGSVGAGMKVRLCLQMFNGIVIAGIAETLALVERCGINITDFSDILELNGTNCQLVKNTTRDILDGVFMPADFQLGLMQKEIQHAVSMANDRMSQPTMIASLVSNLFLLAKTKGEETGKCSSIYRIFQDSSLAPK